MKPRSIVAAAAFLCALAVPGAASAATAFITTTLNMRAGPSTAYPVVAVLGSGNQVEVYGCLSGYSWCDVSIGPSRGWVAGSYLEYVYQQRRVLVPAYGATIGLPIVSFTFGNYWDRYYSGRSFYRERSRYRDIRQDRRRERREDRQEVREDRRERVEDRRERVEDRRERVEDRKEVREDRQEVREDRQQRRKDIQQNRAEKRDERQDRQRCLAAGGTAEQCRQ